jgi:hypothetical protein
MAEVTSSDLDDTHWAISEDVREHIDIPTQGNETDVEKAIISATHTVQAWWKKATDGDIPADLPETDSSNPNKLEQDHPLLVKATELLAASEKHESIAQNIRAGEDGEDRKHVYLEDRAKSKFDNWVTRNGYDVTDTTQSDATDSSTTGKSSSLVDLG